ncbi:hypothetical protein [Longispora albida]|uniref:hypothetical protein n=1 Tax=Longispora albida TaxID=203523 RepID=UPI00036CAA70|nr:hypothetical protein [Longispora albida]
MLAGRGWGPEHTWVLDLQTSEGALFLLGGLAAADLNKTRIWVCPLFEPMLTWLYAQYRLHPDTWWERLPARIDLDGVPLQLRGYRRPGPHERPGVAALHGAGTSPQVTASIVGAVRWRVSVCFDDGTIRPAEAATP